MSLPEILRVEEKIDDNHQLLFRVLDTNGDGTGTKAATGDYSVTPGLFYIQPPVGTVYNINTLTVHVGDTGALTAEGYGAGIALTNGIAIKVKDGSGDLVDLLDGIALIDNELWAHLYSRFTFQNFAAAASFYSSETIFPEKLGRALVLNGDSGEYLEVALNDDFSGLDHQHFIVTGYWHKVYAR